MAGSSEPYIVNVDESKMKWTGFYVFNFGEHHGTIDLAGGEIITNGTAILSGHFDIDMRSIRDLDMPPDDGAKDLEQHLKSSDFFSVEEFPTAKFKITSVERMENKPDDPTAFKVIGDLSIKGITAPLEFPAHITVREKSLEAKARFKFDRTAWNIRYNSGKFFSDIGDGTISDAIAIDLTLVATR
jgi:polyisoprenoid-binding protein YceI